MYKGTANSHNKVWYGGDNLYWECPDRDDNSLPKFCIASSSTRGDTNTAAAPRNGSSIYIPDHMSSLVTAMPPQWSFYTF